MRVSLPWLKELQRRTMSDQDIVQALERAGIEIEQFSSPTPINQNIVVALVKKVVQHPGADRLKIATVDDGREEFTIVCGAPNVREGIKTPLARIGAVLPDGTTISEAKLRGEISHGMLCSERELGLGDSHDGILELSSDLSVGTLLCDVYPAEGFVDIKTSANRFDLLGSIGLAREIAAMTAGEVAPPPITPLAEKRTENIVGKLGDGCTRFMVAELTVNPSAPTPPWMISRLAAAGIRSLGLVIDITNYVMLETAQPLHAYNADTVGLPFGVRAAEKGEKLVTLDEKTRELVAGDLIVTDKNGIIGLAGVRGGAATEITSQTVHIFLEAATFDGAMVRQTARRHNLRTDASARYERRLPPQLAELAIARAIFLLREHGDAEVKTIADSGFGELLITEIQLSSSHVSRILGTTVTAAEVVSSVGKLGIRAAFNDDAVVVHVPWWRPDLKEAEDVIEEVVRVIGMDRIPSTLPAWRPKSLEFDRKRPALSRVRNLLSGAGLFEIMTYSFVSADQLSQLGLETDNHLKVKNPLSLEQAYLRKTLLPSHLAVAERNRMYSQQLGFYELSTVFIPRGNGEQPTELLHLGILVTSQKNAYGELKGWLDAIGSLLNLAIEIEPANDGQPWADGRVAEVSLNGQIIGSIGQIHPEVVTTLKLKGEMSYLELQVEPMLEAERPVQYVPLGRFPRINRDITVTVPQNTTWRQVTDALADVPHLSTSFANDYVGKGVPDNHKNLSLHLVLTNLERTPTDAEADDLQAKVRSILHRKLNALLEE